MQNITQKITTWNSINVHNASITSPENLSYVHLHIHTIRNGIPYDVIESSVKQKRCANTVTQLSSPSRSDNDSRAKTQIVSELDDSFKARLEFLGLNVDLRLGDLSITRSEFPGLDVDSELDDLSVACLEISEFKVDLGLGDLSITRFEFPGLEVDSELYDLSIACPEFSGSKVDLGLGDLSMTRCEFPGLEVDSELDDLSTARLEILGDSELGGLSVACLKISGLNAMSSMDGTVIF